MKKTCYTLLLSISAWACQEPTSSNPTHELPTQKMTQRADNWENEFYKTTGWFGGDGIFSIPLNGKEFVLAGEKDTTLFLFSDSLIKLKGSIKNGEVKSGEYKMIHNSLGLLQGRGPGNGLAYHWEKDEEGQPLSVFTPDAMPGHEEDYFWLGDGFVNTAHDSTLYIFAYRVRDIVTDGFFPFEQKNVTILKVKKGQAFPFTEHIQIPTELMYEVPQKFGKTTYGSAILVNTEAAGAPHPDGYIYIYGTVGYYKDLIVARVLPEAFENLAEWTFWDGATWNPDKYAVKAVTSNTANELSVSPLPDGRYMLVCQKNGMEPQVDIQMAKSPVGPFYPKKTIWYCEEVDEDKDYFAYNAKAHPHISPDGKLLISYNLNSFDFFKDVLTKAHHYRPRFINLDMD
ncbi:MAG: hypothetical protein DHS20C18_28690 [Saprospiraceae bacterium]|nr:MAG: hypothetical protein DHS20C18_28690 [Saprospiraceae bacterium]